MKILTTYPIEIQTKDFSTHSQQGNLDTAYGSKDYAAPNGLGYSSLDGSNSASVKLFQSWANSNHSANLKVDGMFGPLSSAAYDKWGAEWEKTQPRQSGPAAQSPSAKSTKKINNQLISGGGALGGRGLGGPPIEQVVLAPATTPTTSLVDKFKALPNGAKVGIYIAGFGIAALVVWKLTKKKK